MRLDDSKDFWYPKVSTVRLCSNFWYGGFPKFGVAFLVVPIIMIMVYWGLYWGPPILGNYLNPKP